MTYTIADAYEDVRENTVGDLTAFAVGFLVEKTRLEEEYRYR